MKTGTPVVVEQMQKAQLVVLQFAGISPESGAGLRWEITTAIRVVQPERLLFVFYEDWMVKPNEKMSAREDKEKRFASFRELVRDCVFAERLPENLRDSVFMYFDSSWNPAFLPLQYYSDAEGAYRGCSIKVLESLKPFLAN